MIQVNEQQIAWQPGLTINKILALTKLEFPHLVVAVNDQVIPNDDFVTYEVPDNANVKVILIAHGG